MSVVTSPGEPDIIQYWKFEDAVVWDGVSAFESGVIYDISNTRNDPDMKKIWDSGMTLGEKAAALLDQFMKKRGTTDAN